MENIDRDLLLNYYFKDGYLFYVPDRLIFTTVEDSFYDKPESVLKEEDRCISSISS